MASSTPRAATEEHMAGLCIAGSESSPHIKLAAEIVSRGSLLLTELEAFQSFLQESNKDGTVNFKGLKNDVETELRFLKALPLDNPEKCLPSLSCTNIPFFEAVWSTAKRSTGVKTLLSSRRRNKVPEHLHRANLLSTTDVVSKNGLEWVKVSTITERRMIFDLAKSGWAEGDISDEEPEIESVGLLKSITDIVQVAKSVRVRYKSPTVRLVLTRIRMQQCQKQVLKVLQRIRDLGVILETADDALNAPTISEAFHRMLPDPFDGFSDTLNVDTTLLIAFISDMTHDKLQSKDWHNRNITDQITREAKKPLLPSHLWPACGSRKLVCTHEAADRALEIVATIASGTEQRRAALLLSGDVTTSDMTQEERIEEFQKLSRYHIPMDWQLPIEVVDIDLEKIKTKLPAVAEKVLGTLSTVNSSVSFFGWISGYTTISTNCAVAKNIENIIEDNRRGDEAGPVFWTCIGARSLVGTEKGYRSYREACRDHLVRETASGNLPIPSDPS